MSEDTSNELSVFEIAQENHSSGQYRTAIDYYKLAIAGFTWKEDVWYCYYMISKCYIALSDLNSAEEWVMSGYHVHPTRSEALYHLCVQYRNTAQHNKAYHLYKLGANIPYPHSDVLSVESEIYLHRLFDYELTILHYYLFSENRLEGLIHSLNYLNLGPLPNSENVFNNLNYYVGTLSDNGGEISVFEVDPPNGFINSSPCKIITSDGEEIVNIRQVNYIIDQSNGAYHYASDGQHMTFENTSVRPVNTKNYLLGHGEMTDLYSVDMRPGSRIVGLEDLRLYEVGGEIKFLATACNVTKNEAIRICTGEYDRENRIIYVNKVFDSPSGEYCEKNWTFLDSSTLIYKWSPLTTYAYADLTLVNEHPTPLIFNKFRGSSSVIEYGEHRLAVVHSVHHDSPRKYLHWLVMLDSLGRPVGYSIPFSFEGNSIEYCLSCVLSKENIVFQYSTWDSSSREMTIPIAYFLDKIFYINEMN